MIFDGDRLLRVTPEYDTCRRLAAVSGQPLPAVYRQVERAADELFESRLPGDESPEPGSRDRDSGF